MKNFPTRNPLNQFVWNAIQGITLLGGVLAVFERADAAEQLTLAKCDGLELRASASRLNEEGRIADVNFEIVNKNADTVYFDSTGENIKLFFRLFKENGENIPPDEDWARANMEHEGGVGAHAEGRILPGKKRNYTLHLDEAFGENWKLGTRLTAEWRPGLDGMGHRIMIGRELKAAVKLPLAGGQIETEPNPSNGATDPSPQTESHSAAKQPPNSEQSSPHNQWLLWALAILAGLGVLAFVIKRKSE